MAELQPPIHSLTGSKFIHPNYFAGPLSNLSNIYPHPHGSHLPPQVHRASDRPPATIDESGTWNAPSQGVSSTLIGPGQNPDQGPRPCTQPRHHTGAANNADVRKRKRTTLGSVETSLVGGFGPQSPGETVTETGSLSPSSPPFARNAGRRSTTCNVWAFACPLVSGDVPPANQWPTSTGLRLTGKPNTPWFGCTLCFQFGCVICVPSPRSLIITIVQSSDQSGVKRWRVFNNNKKSSPTTPFRRHLKDHHASIWVQECTRLHIPAPSLEEAPERSTDTTKTEPFTREGLSRRLVKFISSNDQVRLPNFVLEDSLDDRYRRR